MDIEKKRTLFFGGLIALVILASIGYFFWGTVFDKGTVNLIAQPPFTVEKIEGELLECKVLPCEMKLRSGPNELIFRKEGFKSAVKDVDVKLWNIIDFNVNFQVVPTISKADKFPEKPSVPEYEIGYDTKYKKYELIRKDDEQNIVYFNRELNDNQIFGGRNYVLILGPKSAKKTTVYKIDVRTKSRDAFDIENLGDVKEGVLSDDGKYLAFHKSDSDEIFVLAVAGAKVYPLGLELSLSQVSWTYDDGLIFSTKKNFQSKNFNGKYQGNYIGFLEGDGNVLLFGAYHPEENSFSELVGFDIDKISTKDIPDLIIAATNGQIIYFQSGNEEYKIVLRQF